MLGVSHVSDTIFSTLILDRHCQDTQPWLPGVRGSAGCLHQGPLPQPHRCPEQVSRCLALTPAASASTATAVSVCVLLSLWVEH